MKAIAYAKINLALHLRRRRKDGYHDLETVFAFVDAGDLLSVKTGQAEDRIEVVGEFAGALAGAPVGDNILAAALNAFPRPGANGPDGWHVTLEKNLPVAAGLGGGSADAGALIRLICETYGWPDDWRERAAKLGADVPACVISQTCVGTGTGTDLTVVESDLTGMSVLLVNPRKPLSTGPVFKAWNGIDRGPLPKGSVREQAVAGRNDMEAGARTLVPEIAGVIGALKGTRPWLARMSGSGASCFAIYDGEDQRDAAAAEIAASHPEWWQMTGKLL
ncbi:4-(cytidine 5'-diphospho)-2-C-methyl-D-erythritol kinase [Croceicoccus mobilis]|uniref:4-diphosphocytidyl-2-C-methyl-D-erythritol kinase n=1 Tax=Croceicoccus mobilis TaxID=1703339 RepID=A0A916ZAV8_9SPHN|nr:4-(cytidine 5'-diphospho)-2-C-methyl-D-erythritol kinase [Croceicoccus mobilis]GGD83502.1 4-diphosphocytidyl-2-C-methyl-D-erythritol kinase [Croceicoccus mobilis]